MKMIANSSGNGIAGTIDSNYFKGTGTRRGHEREFVVMAAYGVVSKGNGETWVIPEKHTSLSTGGDKPDKDIRVS